MPKDDDDESEGDKGDDDRDEGNTLAFALEDIDEGEGDIDELNVGIVVKSIRSSFSGRWSCCLIYRYKWWWFVVVEDKLLGKIGNEEDEEEDDEEEVVDDTRGAKLLPLLLLSLPSLFGENNIEGSIYDDDGGGGGGGGGGIGGETKEGAIEGDWETNDADEQEDKEVELLRLCFFNAVVNFADVSVVTPVWWLWWWWWWWWWPRPKLAEIKSVIICSYTNSTMD